MLQKDGLIDACLLNMYHLCLSFNTLEAYSFKNNTTYNIVNNQKPNFKIIKKHKSECKLLHMYAS